MAVAYNPSKEMWFYGFKAHTLVTCQDLFELCRDTSI
ncbi:hypothetical protein; putative transposase fragment [Streptococcus mutans UA159]|uniref:Uncharacterized protein n=1 Tax=Streptococcus mutans serotype c (strain ATCC 700610 / UA159) TaxID=210007 RepID=Q8DWG4_STRMU|nr:hypothetical protein; putative transposase fragment [Streptococcus mutans UA159]